ncbi:hypothetical protein GCM10022254_26550 [Actinomadura meridiana]|uniref:Uncharacterized protein n=1 Tax=Actinomadura meridiana TaxID=559626 RepID=A0ABP8BZ25_9ACTN
MVHWHFWRMECEFSGLAGGRSFSVDLFCVLRRYPDTGAAWEAVGENVVERFPDAGVNVPPSASADSKVVYEISSTHFVMWRLIECLGDCGGVGDLIESGVRDYLVEKFGDLISVVRRNVGR